MIYLDNVLQKKVLATFHYALNNNGYLMLGKSETIGASTLFSLPEKKHKIYLKKTEATAKAMLEMNYRIPGIERAETGDTQKIVQKNAANVPDLEKLINKILLTNYIPASVVVNNELEILQFRGSTSLFLEPSQGKASLNLMKMARPELVFELRNAIHKSTKTGEPAKKSGILVKSKSNTHNVSIEVVPLKIDPDEKFFIIVFEEVKEPVVHSSNIAFTKDKYIKQLQDELNIVKEDMRAIIEEQEANNEELQSANEEIVSSNEELQSINEELETSKEEIESSNEELMTINTELQLRNEQLSESYEYAEAMFGIIREAVIVLDENLSVKTANNAFYKLFKLTEGDIQGNLIYELSNRRWNIPRLRRLLEDVIPANAEIENFEVSHDFPSIGEKVLLLNAKRVIQKTHQQQLILLAIEDITDHRKAEKLLSEREAWFHTMADNAPVMIWVEDTNKQRIFFNKTLLEFTGRKLEQEKGSGWTENVYKDDLAHLLEVYYSSFDERKPFHTEYRLRRHDGEYRWVMSSGTPTYSANGNFTGYIGTLTDIHNQKMLNVELDTLVQQRTYELQEINKELEHSNAELEQFAYVASHDLQEPLRKIITFSDRLQAYKDDLPDMGKKYVEKIESSSWRMSRLIDDLLNFSSTARADKEFVATDLDEILKDLIGDFDVIVSQKNATINYDKLPLIEAIPLQMEQLFHNIISNALKFSKEDEAAVIKISARKVSREEINRYQELEKSLPHIEIIFEDNGIGFPPEFAEQIFVIFQRLNDQKNYTGTGIGLALCRKIVSNHSGKIYAESKPGEGTKFHIILPEHQAGVVTIKNYEQDQ